MTAIGSDGLPPGTGGRPHPRTFATFPRVLGRYVRESGLLTLEEAIRRATSLPARIFGLRDRGRIERGAAADLVTFDPSTIADHATYDDPVLTVFRTAEWIPPAYRQAYLEGAARVLGREALRDC